MSESSKVSYDVLTSLEAGWVAFEDRSAKIGADPSKGIPDDVPVPFQATVFNVTEASEATEVFNMIGADVFNALLNYAADLKLRGRAVQAERAKLTSDPYKKESKAVALLYGEDAVERYAELRRNGHSKEDALAQLS